METSPSADADVQPDAVFFLHLLYFAKRLAPPTSGPDRPVLGRLDGEDDDVRDLFDDGRINRVDAILRQIADNPETVGRIIRPDIS